MKKSLYHTLLFIFSATLSILTILFSCNGWGRSGNKNITYLITMDFDPNTNNFSNGQVKVTRDDTEADISNLRTPSGKKTHLEMHNEDPLPANTYAIKLITIRDSIAVAKKKPIDFCKSWRRADSVGLNRSDSRVPLTLNNKGNTNSITFTGWFIYSFFGDENKSDGSNNNFQVRTKNNGKCKVHYRYKNAEPIISISTKPIISISNRYKQNCIALTTRYNVKNGPKPILPITGSMQIVFNELKTELKKPERPAGLYEGSTLYGDSVFHFKVRKLSSINNGNKNNLTVDLKWYTVQQGKDLYKINVNGRAIFSIDGSWSLSQALLLTITKNTPLYCPYLPLDLKTIEEKILGVVANPQDVSCDLYMTYKVYLTDLHSGERHPWIDGQALRIKPVQTDSFQGALDIDFTITSDHEPKNKSGILSIPVTVNAELTPLQR